ncbi:hypothetical protein ADIMK_3149 [Marinobacterium lacunae]|uniref:Uncharacterized protein n=1 Tax=Marinobacterium lacunae TaxID=1232683 RepID=A0A081FVX2_9GAMM|nr:hypothetical protein [Marinobacterium lacunae]KEA62677.1 hypothetical protein ADIMK_3149 [Marinobacterium lacunae]
MNLHIPTLVLIGALGIAQPCYAQAEKDSASIEEVKRDTQELIKSIGSFTADKKIRQLKKQKTA